jgi:hypothetical protein
MKGTDNDPRVLRNALLVGEVAQEAAYRAYLEIELVWRISWLALCVQEVRRGQRVVDHVD